MKRAKERGQYHKMQQEQEMTFQPQTNAKKEKGKPICKVLGPAKYWQVTKKAIKNRMHYADLKPRDETLIPGYNE